MTLREVTRTMLKLVEDASGCPRGLGLFFAVLELRPSGMGSPRRRYLVSIKHPWYIFSENRSGALGMDSWAGSAQYVRIDSAEKCSRTIGNVTVERGCLWRVNRR